jgi:DinB superfamily
VDKREISDEMRRAQADLHGLVSRATAHDLARRSDGTRWTNRQLLFHMLLGYGVVRTLMPLVHILGRLGHSRGFAATLNAGRRPFHVINYLGSWGGGQLLTLRTVVALFDRTIDALQRGLDAETESSLDLCMHFPTDWDPYFKPVMTVLEVYHFGTQHFDHHQRQLTL